MVPEKMTGSCGTSASRERRSRSPMDSTSCPSMRRLPPQGSTSRYSVIIMVDLPQPVRPAMPTFSAALMEKLMPLSTGGRSARYFTVSCSAVMAPRDGQPAGGRWPSTTCGASDSTPSYSIMRSTEFMLTSSSVDWRTIQVMRPVRLSAEVSARPARPLWVGSTTATSSAVPNETVMPMSSRRTLSQRFTTWMGHQHWLDASSSSWFLSKNMSCRLNARTVVRPDRVSPKWLKMGLAATLSSRLSSRLVAMKICWSRQ
mmetsp:Transcript_6916/g.17694  ORF Transcript_6916/g.17694 Transcript_6916/m.17694 type:complete len:258 (+) Transcript_6916:567-1340(+)